MINKSEKRERKRLQAIIILSKLRGIREFRFRQTGNRCTRASRRLAFDQSQAGEQSRTATQAFYPRASGSCGGRTLLRIHCFGAKSGLSRVSPLGTTLVLVRSAVCCESGGCLRS